MATSNEILYMPSIALRGLVIYPNMTLQFDVGRERSLAAAKAALDTNRFVFLITQKDVKVKNPKDNDLYNIGVIAEIKQILKSGNNLSKVVVKGIKRAKLIKLMQTDPYIVAEVQEITEKQSSLTPALQAVIRSVKDTFDNFTTLIPKMPPELYSSVIEEDDPQKIFDNIVFNIPLPLYDRQKLLETITIKRRLEMLNSILNEEYQILKIEQEIQNEVQNRLDENQRDYYLREQMKVISSELGEDDEQSEAFDFYSRLEELHLKEEDHDKIMKEIERLSKMPSASQEAALMSTHIDTILSLPWNKKTNDRIDLIKAQKQLDKDHYGLKKVKERIIEQLSVRAINPDVKGQIICLVGPPGTGKTSIVRSIAESIGRKYVRISLGGVRDEADIRGHRKTYIGAMPGRIINALLQAKVNNPIMLFDEIDKMGNDFKGDPASAMLEVLDSEQNVNFVDHYIEVGFDLSNIFFITTANTLDTIPEPLLDRMEVIELSSYTREEKYHIAKEHLIKKQLKANGLKASQVRIKDDALYSIIDNYTSEAGVRVLERTIATLCRKAAKAIVADGKKSVTYTESNLEEYLGPEKYKEKALSKTDEVGVVNGLAWTSVGGVMLPLETVVLDGTGKVEITGNLGTVMNESSKIAVSYVRSVAERYGIDKEFYKNKDLHIHAIEGAIPKDGPSAGVTMVTSIVSALSGIPVKHDVAMTGEITLHGKVLAIGGLREKLMAAYKNGMKTVIIPKANEADLSEVDDVVKDNLNIILAERLSTVLSNALCEEAIRNTEIPAVSGIINPIKKSKTVECKNEL